MRHLFGVGGIRGIPEIFLFDWKRMVEVRYEGLDATTGGWFMARGFHRPPLDLRAMLISFNHLKEIRSAVVVWQR